MTTYACCSDRRRELLQQQSVLNGIDFVEVVPSSVPGTLPTQLRILFVNELTTVPTKEQVVVAGGERIRSVPVENVSTTADPRELLVDLMGSGDLSPYVLTIIVDAQHPMPPPWLDPVLSEAGFGFAPDCGDGVACDGDRGCPPVLPAGPRIDYLARDWESMRSVLLDRMALLQPDWTERNPADVRTTLVELVAALADGAAYRQDVVATESYLGTARRRISVRRHARLVDYAMRDGTNARVWVHLDADPSVRIAGTAEHPAVPAGTALMTGGPAAPVVVRAASEAQTALLEGGSLLFETMSDLGVLSGQHARMRFYTWEGSRCCLPAGTVSATLDGHFPDLVAGQVLLLVEHRDPVGAEHAYADAEPARRHPVRLTAAIAWEASDPLTDPLSGHPITEITWAAEDALPFALTVSVEVPTDAGGTEEAGDAALALGNVVLADHGATQRSVELGTIPEGRFTVALPKGPVTQVPLVRLEPSTSDAEDLVPFDPSAPAARAISPAPDLVLASVMASDEGGPWRVRADLISSGEQRDVVVEVDDESVAWLRFGRSWSGRELNGAVPTPGNHLEATYRVGNGARGNVGAGSIRVLVTGPDTPAELAAVTAPVPQVRVSNPMPARGGTDPETIDEVRQRAPWAFRQQLRAVTEEDYARRAELAGGPGRLVQRAVATIRWTGSWYRVVVAVDPVDGVDPSQEFLDGVAAYLDDFRMAGHDVQVVQAQYAPLEVRLAVTVDPLQRRDLVAAALAGVMSNRRLPDGTLGHFHPDRLTFAEDVYLGPIVAAAQGIPGVVAVVPTAFRRYGLPGTDARSSGRIDIGPAEIARLDSDPSRPDRGIFRLDRLEGGR